MGKGFGMFSFLLNYEYEYMSLGEIVMIGWLRIMYSCACICINSKLYECRKLGIMSTHEQLRW